MDLAAGAWIDKDKVYYTSKCPDVVSDAKKEIKKQRTLGHLQLGQERGLQV